ncbi:MAG: hypothetical protein OJF59_000588 [Cytophagales bacterium]|jgi:hypothetical protein|nr:MAG: hypothetical protein OJF59_000588 [Cytophagales bacterium]
MLTLSLTLKNKALANLLTNKGFCSFSVIPLEHGDQQQ